MSDLPVPTTAELREQWDRFAPLFEARMERTTVLLARQLAAQLRLEEAAALLEVGAGAGAAALAARETLAAGARHVVTDLSPEMVARARRKLPAEVEVAEANACALEFPTASFDRLLGNLCLMLVPDPDAALSEAARVLRPGGIAAWSVWGRPADSLLFTLPGLAAQELGLELPAGRSNFHLGERDALRARVEGHGFQRVRTWYALQALPIARASEFCELILATPRWVAALADLEPARRERFAAILTRLADEALAAGRPIALEALVVVAER